MANPSTINTESSLTTGRNPVWSQQTDYLTRPTSTTDGISMEVLTGGTVSCQIQIELRPLIHRRSGRIVVDTFDAGATYTVGIDGTNEVVATPTDVDDLLTTMRDDLNANGTINLIITATALDVDDVDVVDSGQPAVTLALDGVGESNWALSTLSATGSGVWSATADAVTGTAQLLSLPRGTALNSSETRPAGWAFDGSTLSLNDYNRVERLNVAGRSRAYALLTLTGVTGGTPDAANVTPTAGVYWGPATDSSP